MTACSDRFDFLAIDQSCSVLKNSWHELVLAHWKVKQITDGATGSWSIPVFILKSIIIFSYKLLWNSLIKVSNQVMQYVADTFEFIRTGIRVLNITEVFSKSLFYILGRLYSVTKSGLFINWNKVGISKSFPHFICWIFFASIFSANEFNEMPLMTVLYR